jgi:hypothetical protein
MKAPNVHHRDAANRFRLCLHLPNNLSGLSNSNLWMATSMGSFGSGYIFPLDFLAKLFDYNLTSYPADPPQGLSRVIFFEFLHARRTGR